MRRAFSRPFPALPSQQPPVGSIRMRHTRLRKPRQAPPRPSCTLTAAERIALAERASRPRLSPPPRSSTAPSPQRACALFPTAPLLPAPAPRPCPPPLSVLPAPFPREARCLVSQRLSVERGGRVEERVPLLLSSFAAVDAMAEPATQFPYISSSAGGGSSEPGGRDAKGAGSPQPCAGKGRGVARRRNSHRTLRGEWRGEGGSLGEEPGEWWAWGGGRG